jgi:hypothetical protein
VEVPAAVSAAIRARCRSSPAGCEALGIKFKTTRRTGEMMIGQAETVGQATGTRGLGRPIQEVAAF